MIGLGIAIPKIAVNGGRGSLVNVIKRLFANGEQGAWYDPSDFDRYMSELGPELVVSYVTPVDVSLGAFALQTVQDGAFTPGAYKVTLGITNYSSGQIRVQLYDAATGSVRTDYQTSGNGLHTFTLITTQAFDRIRLQALGTGFVGTVDNISVRELTAIDTATLYQDAAGTTPVTAVEQPVGLILDKSKGGRQVLGVTGWTVTQGAGVYSISENVITVTSVSSMLYVSLPTSEWAIGDFAEIEITAQSVTGTCLVYLGGVPQAITNGQKTYRIIVSSNNLCRLVFASGASGVFTISSRAKTPGNHATQTTSTSRPVLSARVNLLTKTEQFDDGVWTKTRATITANAVVSPDGTLTADKLIEDTTASNTHLALSSILTLTSASTNTVTVYVKAAERVWCRVANAGVVNGGAFVNLATGQFGTIEAGVTASSIQDVGNGWYRVSVTGVLAGTAAQLAVQLSTGNGNTSYTGDGTSGIYIWGASLVPANQADLPYQRVNTATDYDSGPAKFPRYLRCDGIDDGMVTGTITPGTDKAQVFAGVRKLSDAAQSCLVELSNSVGNPGAFGVFSPASASANMSFGSTGSIFSNAVASGYAAPITNTLAGIGDISGDISTLRVNGTQAATSSTNQGTGNYLAYPLYLFRRGGTSLPFNGHFYGGIIRFGDNLPIETIEQTEAWMAAKTGVTL